MSKTRTVSRRDFARTSMAAGSSGGGHPGQPARWRRCGRAPRLGGRRRRRGETPAAFDAPRGFLRRLEPRWPRCALTGDARTGRSGAKALSRRLARRHDDSRHVLRRREAFRQRRTVHRRALLADGRPRKPDSQARGLFRLRVRPRRQRHHRPRSGGRREGVSQRLPPSRLTPVPPRHGQAFFRPNPAPTASRSMRGSRWSSRGRAGTPRCSAAPITRGPTT